MRYRHRSPHQYSWLRRRCPTLAWRLSMFLLRNALELPASGLREADADTGVVDTAAAVGGVAVRRAVAEAVPTAAGAARAEDAAAAESEGAAAAESAAVHSEDAAAAVFGLGRCQSVNLIRSKTGPCSQKEREATAAGPTGPLLPNVALAGALLNAEPRAILAAISQQQRRAPQQRDAGHGQSQAIHHNRYRR